VRDLISANQVARLFSDYDGGRIGVRVDESRHDRAVANPTACDMAHPKFWVDHGFSINPMRQAPTG
jgi:hypothetical protein